MSSEDQEILAKISQLAGQINRHKNGQPSDRQTQSIPASGTSNSGSVESLARSSQRTTDRFDEPSSLGWRPTRSIYSSRGYSRGTRANVHRHRTLVLNGNTPTPPNPATEEPGGENLENATSSTAAQGWVTKTDRHLQLINTSIFEKDSQNRAKAIEETRKQKLRQRNERERSRFNKHLYRMGGNTDTDLRVQTRSTDSTDNYEISVQGIRFRVAKNGSKLVKVPGDLNAAKSTPKTALVGGVRFYRSKNGNLFRSGIIKAQRYGGPRMAINKSGISPLRCNADFYNGRKTGDVKKINEPCRTFTTTGIFIPEPYIYVEFPRGGPGLQLITSLGSCSKGPRCRYIHNPSKVAACKEFLLKGACPSGDSCDLSHDLTPERTPACLHFAKGNCSNPNCRYAHVRVSPTALVCRPFGIYGYCERGASCDLRHANECPDFSNTGTCPTRGCKLPHRHKASLMRTNTPSAADESSDISSEEDEEIGSDDVDSDDLEEFFGDEDGKEDTDIPMQEDFVQLS